jgi:hypothetical protein
MHFMSVLLVIDPVFNIGPSIWVLLCALSMRLSVEKFALVAVVLRYCFSVFLSSSLCLLLAVVMAEEGALLLGSFCFAGSGELVSAVFASGTGPTFIGVIHLCLTVQNLFLSRITRKDL